MSKPVKEKLSQISIRFGWLRLPVLLLSMVAAGYGFYAALNPDIGNNNQHILPAVLAFCWCLLIFCLLTVLPERPNNAGEKKGFFPRLLARLLILLRSVLAVALVALTVALVIVTYKLLTTGIG